MRESRTYGSVRGACDETHVPTATTARVHHAARRCGGLAARGAGAAAGDAGDRVSPQPRRLTTIGGPSARIPPGPEGNGYVEGQNVAIEYRWAEDQNDRVPALVADLGSPAGRRDRVVRSPALAAKAATTTVPIVFAAGGDPVREPAMPVVGFLNGQWPDTFAHAAAAFREGLKETGFVDGQNVTIEYRWAEGQDDRLPAMASELVRRQVAVIAATGASAAADAAKAATSTIPILFIVGVDPVKLGLVASLNRPGGNLTGVNQFINTLSAKRLELLREMLPGLTSIAFLLNPDSPQAEFESLDLQTAARAIGVRIEILTARNAHDIDALSPILAQHATRHISRAICLGNSLPSAPLRSHNVLLTCDNRAAGVRRSYARTRGHGFEAERWLWRSIKPKSEMSGRQLWSRRQGRTDVVDNIPLGVRGGHDGRS